MISHLNRSRFHISGMSRKFIDKSIFCHKVFLCFSLLVIITFLSINTFASSVEQFDSSSLSSGNSGGSEGVFKKQYHIFNKYLNDYEYMVSPISGAVSGAKLCGPYCALIGAGAGVIDELLVNYGYADTRYLTWLSTIYSSVSMLNIPIVGNIGSGVVLAIVLPMIPYPSEVITIDKTESLAVGSVLVSNAALVAALTVKSILPESFFADYAKTLYRQL